MMRAMGVPLEVFRLLRLDGDRGCVHHLLVRAGRPSYPNASQWADDAANHLPDVLIDALTSWCLRWRPFTDCRSPWHGPTVLSETVSEVVYPEPAGVDLDTGTGMHPLDLWIAGNAAGQTVIGVAADAAPFWAAIEADGSEVAGLQRPGRGLRVLFLTDRSGCGDLRDL